MFAVVETGGKQIKVFCGDRFVAESLPDLKNEGNLTNVLSVCDDQGHMHIGAPFLEDAAVKVQAVKPVRGRKVLVFKKKRRHNYRRFKGHRQSGVLLQVLDVTLKGKSLARA